MQPVNLPTSAPTVTPKRVAIVQSNYIPWKGYFDLIHQVDEFILYDDMQYTRRDWRNRNLIKTAHGLQWLTIPVQVKGKFHQKIRETEVTEADWRETHWQTLAHNYARAPYFAQYRDWLEDLFRNTRQTNLSQINYRFLVAICQVLGIQTRLSWSTDYELCEGKTEKLVHLCRQAGATMYISGPAARDYIDENLFQAAGIALDYIDYSGYPEYQQLYAPFEHGVSILDLIVNTGPAATTFMKSFSR